MLYIMTKNLHMLTIAISVSFLTLRFVLMLMDSPLLQKKWLKIAPHANDTVLLLSGITLVLITHFYPFTPQGAWLTEKITCVLAYIALGFVALKLGPSKKIRAVAYFGALGWLYWAVQLALTKVPTF